jgi:hypothetical protein
MRILVLLILYVLLFAKDAFATINFQISNFEKVNDYYSVDASISGAASSSAYYVQAMFTPTDSNNYFGYTWSQKGEWFKYISSPDKEYIKSNFPLLETGLTKKFLVKPDPESSKYTGPGEYLLKLKRYTGESSSGTYSDNSLTVSLSDTTPTPTVTPSEANPPLAETPTQIPTTTPTPTITPTPTATAPTNSTLTPTIKKTATPSAANPPLAETSTSNLVEKAISASIGSEILGASIAATLLEIDPIPSEPQISVNQPSQTDSVTAIAVGITSLGLLGIIFYRLWQANQVKGTTPRQRG